ncbi:MAG: DUF1015 domain-containing protein [Flavobacteriales bacterium]|jgi:uncharacterized protein (DUF1015 family)|nr:DUF1015 domain-containing protein [Flavobacteriales bacterium]
MIALRPFRAWRPVADKAHLVASRSYVSYTEEQLAEKLQGNPFTFLHVIHPPGLSPTCPRDERFRAVRTAFDRFRGEEENMQRDERPCFHLYEQRARGIASFGLIAGVSVADYHAGRIKAHEQTLAAREDLFAEYLDTIGINAEPVLLATPGDDWAALIAPVATTRPEYDYTTTDRVRHRLWPIDDPALHKALLAAFARIPALYIADGHHRMASSARLAARRGARDEHPAAWCLACIVPRSQLHILNFDRTVAGLNGMDEAAFLRALGRTGRLRPTNGPEAAPGVVAVRTAGGWHALELPPPPPTYGPAQRLDPARLGELVLAPLLHVHNPRTDPAVDFVPGTHGTDELERRVANGLAAAAFHLHPVGFDELMAVADAGATMPPKSTWIEPKLRSGLVVYPLDPDR